MATNGIKAITFAELQCEDEEGSCQQDDERKPPEYARKHFPGKSTSVVALYGHW
jgi:hypothetical protein